jgi:type VI secretion system protein ImpE
MFLFQLFCVLGEWDKALKQLETLVQLSSEAQMLGAAYNQVIAAEKMREAVFAGELDLLVLIGDGGWAQGVAQGISLIAKGEVEAGLAARDAAFDQAPEMPGEIDGEAFEWLADADGRFGPTFEAIIAGRYGLVPFDQVQSITSEGPQDLRDTVWYPVQIMFKSGQSVAAFLPVRYPGSAKSDDANIVLGRATGWVDRDWGQEGAGQRLWMFSEGDDRGILDLRSLNMS